MRRMCLIIGMMLLAALWLGPLPEAAPQRFAAHMTMHMGVVAVAAPLIAIGLARGRFDPVRAWPQYFHPIVASVVEMAVVWGWHAPGLHHFARSGWMGLGLEQGMFLAAGLFVWMSALGGDGSGRRAAAGVIGLLLTAMHMTLLGALLALAPRPIYHGSDAAGAVGAFATGGLFAGLSPLEDQQLGGAIMLLIGGIAYLAGGLYLSATVLRGAPATGDEVVVALGVEEGNSA